MAIRLNPLVHEQRFVHWAPVAGINLGWKLGVWCPKDRQETVGPVLEAFLANSRNLDPSPWETLMHLHQLIQTSAGGGHRALTLHDGVSEYYLEVEEGKANG